ncbi:MAG: flavodoxin, partial [Thermocrispum agreste]
IREWLSGLGSVTVQAATFDTKISRPRLPGSAARGAARALRRAGCRLVARPETFYVEAKAGPLLDGEIDRAKEWGNRLASVVAGRTPGR